jgi:hypothetical protein
VQTLGFDVRWLGFSSDGAQLLAGLREGNTQSGRESDTYTVVRFIVANGALVKMQPLGHAPFPIKTFAVSEDTNRIVAADAGAQIGFWDRGGCEGTLDALPTRIKPVHLAFDGRGDILIAGEDGGIARMDSETCTERPSKELADAKIKAVVSSADGAKRVVLTDTGEVWLWTHPSRDHISLRSDGRVRAEKVMLSDDGTLLVVRFDDDDVLAWNWNTGTCYLTGSRQRGLSRSNHRGGLWSSVTTRTFVCCTRQILIRKLPPRGREVDPPGCCRSRLMAVVWSRHFRGAE